MQRNLIFLFVLLLGTTVSWGQKYAIVTYSTGEGLPQSQVTAISQDKEGYLWVATLGGLAKFNGGEFTTFSSVDGLLNNRIKTLSYFDDAIWVGHDGGISIIRNNKIENIGFTGNDKSRSVSAIIKFKHKILVACNGGGLFELKGKSFQKINLASEEHDRIRGALVYKDRVFLVTKSGVLVSNDGVHFKVYTDVPALSYSGIFGAENILYFTTYREGIFRQNMTTRKVKSYGADQLKDYIAAISCGYVDRSGKVWLNSGQGVVRIDKDESISVLGSSSGLPLKVITCFFEDSEGNFWMGSGGKGIFRFPGESFQYYDQTDEFPSSLFLTGFQKKNGDFFLGSYDHGIIKMSKDGTVSNVYSNAKTIWCSIQDVGGLDWFGTQEELVSIDPAGTIKTYTEADGIPGRITSFYKLSGNQMYVGGSKGAAVYRNGTFSPLGGPNDEFIGTVRDFVVHNGDLYCATNLGIFVYKKGKFVQFKGIENVVYNLKADESGNMWYGTEEGLYRYDGKNIERISLRSNPGSNYIGFLNYRKGELFVGTNNGLFVLSELDQDLPKIERFGVREGIVDLETNLNSGFFDQEGNFWFGTASGLVCYDPTQNKKSNRAPMVELKSILLNYQPFNYSTYSTNLDEKGFPTMLELPSSKNNLIFELDGISLSNHLGLNYQFLLEGLGETWSPLSENPTITFTNLPAGEYTLRMRSVDLDGRISKEIVFPFTILPALYKTWWFIGLCIVLVVLVVIGLFRLRLRRINEANEKEKLEFKARLLQLEQQSMNASMNRHFVFNSLNSIQYFINTQDRVSANKYLTNFAKLIRKNLDSATSDGNVITLQEELERLELYLSLEAMRFKDRFVYEINAHGIDTESIRIPAMIMQPFIENSIIHGILPNEDKKGSIRIDITKDQKNLVISMEDNGIGISKSLSQKHHFEGDHQSKGMEITSKRIELIQKVSSNQIILEGPYEFADNNRSIKGTRVLIKIPLVDLDI